jgi:hypothetical protein
VAKSARPAIAIDKFLDNFKPGAYHRHEDHLCNPLTRFDGKRTVTTVPA